MVECPNRCVDGWKFDPYTHRKTLCEFCADSRKKLIVAGDVDIHKELNLPHYIKGFSFDKETVVPDTRGNVLDNEATEVVKDRMELLINDVSIGVPPDNSILFNLGKKAFENNFIYPYLARAFMSGLTVAPLIDAFNLVQLRSQAEKEGFESEYNKLLDKDVCVIVIDAGATYNCVNSVKGFMQLRANRDKSTIIFTHTLSGIDTLCVEDEEKVKSLAEMVSIKYIGVSEQVEEPCVEQNKRGMSADAFAQMRMPRNNL